MESTTERLEVRREIAIAASPETVWELLADPKKLVTWMGISAVLEPTPGGLLRIEVIPGNVASGEVVEIDAPRRLVYTWGWEPGEDGPNAVPPGSSTIEFELVPEGAGTTLRFVHRDLPTADSVGSHAHGWDHYLGRLEVVVSGGEPGEDPWLTQEMGQ